ncbi:hypothetical protein [Streptomyces sp. SCL15-4]|uniref:hypothetical protein n=1 Tax=Streptomyces sp. SCL15-4 TaxID=2967221 RepID=UPI002965D857|nr:hypothetical protein [Streptomyces sp. SCL15-4]
MADTPEARDTQTSGDPSVRARAVPLRRLSLAVAGAAVLIAAGVGVALAAPSDDAPRQGRGVAATVPPDSGTGGTSDGVISSGGTSTDGGLFSGGTSDGGGTSGGDPEEGSVAGSGSTGGLVDGGSSDGSGNAGADGGTGPTDEPTGTASLEELNRRVTELDRKVGQLPTKKELADALRAFADELDHATATETPRPDPS